MLALVMLAASKSERFERFGDGPPFVGALFGLVFLIVPLVVVVYTLFLLRRISADTGRMASALEVIAQRPPEAPTPTTEVTP